MIRAIDIRHAEVGTVTSRVDGAVRFTVITPELTLDQRATILGLHGKNVRCMLEPIDTPVEGMVEVEPELSAKTPCARLRAVLYVLWTQTYKDATQRLENPFTGFYEARMTILVEKVKEKLA